MKTRPSISLFFPVYNDEGTVELMVNRSIETLKQLADDFEIIIVDDCSPDMSGIIADELAKKYNFIRVIHHETNRDYGGALRSGFANSTKDLIFYTDGDAQYDVRELLKLYPYIQYVDMVNGYKIVRNEVLYRKILGGAYRLGMKLLFNLKVKDVDCDFRLMKRSIFEKVSLHCNSGAICLELVKKVQKSGFTIKDVPVQHYSRLSGHTQFFRFNRIKKTLMDSMTLFWELMIKREKA